MSPSAGTPRVLPPPTPAARLRSVPGRNAVHPVDALTIKVTIVLLINACILGGVCYTGLKTFLQRRPRKRATWLVHVAPPAAAHGPAARTDGVMSVHETPTYRAFVLSSVSMGLSMSGALFYPPLGLVSVPLTVYAAFPMFEKAHTTLWRDKRLSASVVCSTTLIGTLAGRYYVLAAFTSWLYYYFALLAQRLRELNQLLMVELDQGYQQFLAQVYGVTPATVWLMVDGMGIETPFADLHVGDVVIVNASEVIPVDGTIVDGSAVVTSLLRLRVSPPRPTAVGERVTAASVVLSGRLHIRVDRL